MENQNSITCNISPGWYHTLDRVKIPYDLEKNPLEIITNRHFGDGAVLRVHFYDALSIKAGALRIDLDKPPIYRISSCQSQYDWDYFPKSPPIVEEDNIYVWRVTLDKSDKDVRFQIHCNETEVLNIIMSDETCSHSKWSDVWGGDKDIEQIEFISDTASTLYRPG